MKARPTTKADETAEFVAFWSAWQPVMNKNDGRGSARDEFFRHVDRYGADPQDIVDGAKWFILNGGNGEFKLHAATWLNRRAYEDGAEAWRTHQKRLAEREAQKPSNVTQMPRSKWAVQYERDRALKAAE